MRAKRAKHRSKFNKFNCSSVDFEVFFNIFGEFRNFENSLNGAESREELQHATKTKDKELRGTQSERRFLLLNLLSNFSVLEFLFRHFGKSKRRERNRSFVKKVEWNGSRGWATLKSFWP